VNNSGYPEQVYFAVRLIKEMGLPRAKQNTILILDYNNERVVQLINDFIRDDAIMNILILLSEYYSIGYNTFFDIVGANNNNYKILEKLLAKGICETFGVNKEYIRINDIIHDYLIRMGLKIPDEYNTKLSKNLNVFIDYQNDDEFITDITNYQYLIKRAIIEKKIDKVKDLLIPSRFPNTVSAPIIVIILKIGILISMEISFFITP